MSSLRLWQVILLSVLAMASAFSPQIRPSLTTQSQTAVHVKVFEEISDFFQNFDDVVDDFMNKRMGNGELFYGKRKFKPSGKPNTEGDYEGMGMSDKSKIDLVREVKAEYYERRRQKELESGKK